MMWILRFFLVITTLLLSVVRYISPAGAQAICGAAPVVADEHEQAILQSAASNALQEADKASFVYKLQNDKNDIFSKYQQGERAVAYYQYVVCRLLEQDKSMPAEDKIAYLDKTFTALFAHNGHVRYNEYFFLVLNDYNGTKKVIRSVLREDGGQWLEIQLNRVQFTFREIERNTDYIWIVDDSRGLELKVPVEGGPSLIRYSKEQWEVWNEMHPETH
jgi:hypothetical protein